MTGRALVCAALLTLVSCGHGSDCPAPTSACPDLLLRGQGYVAVGILIPPAGAPGTLQEVGDATYPACNVCHDPFQGSQSTDVWHLPGASRSRAVLGYREGTSDVYVVYVRQGVDPGGLDLRSWAAPSRIRPE